MAAKRYYDIVAQEAVGAIQWEGTNFNEIMSWAGPDVVRLEDDALFFKGEWGEQQAELEDWIVEGVQKNYYSVTPAEFAEQFTEVAEDENPLDEEGN